MSQTKNKKSGGNIMVCCMTGTYASRPPDAPSSAGPAQMDSKRRGFPEKNSNLPREKRRLSEHSCRILGRVACCCQLSDIWFSKSATNRLYTVHSPAHMLLLVFHAQVPLPSLMLRAHVFCSLLQRRFGTARYSTMSTGVDTA